jgi:hypothetical protein
MPKKSEWASSSRRAGLQNRPTFRPCQNHIIKHMGRSILVTSHPTGQVPGCRAEWVPGESSLHGASAGVMLTRDNEASRVLIGLTGCQNTHERSLH